MARRIKTQEVQKFGGVEDRGSFVEENLVKPENAPVKDINYDLKDIEVESKTKLEEDTGFGREVIIRTFTFAANPEAFSQYIPTKQELFNAHYKGIEIALWKDGLKVVPEQNPQVVLNKAGTRYQIIVGAVPAKGHMLSSQAMPKTLREIAHG